MARLRMRMLCGVCGARIVLLEHRIGPNGERTYAHVAAGLQAHEATPRRGSPVFR